MTTWNYRVFREDDGDHIIREVFYNETGSILGCTEKAVEPLGSSLAELAEDLESFKAALALPVLTLAEIPCCLRKEAQANGNISHEQLVAELGLNG